MNTLFNVGCVILWLIVGFLFVGPIGDLVFITEKPSRSTWQEATGYVAFSLLWPLTLAAIIAAMTWTAVRDGIR